MSVAKARAICFRTKWDEAIADAKQKIKNLEYAIEVYRKMKSAGEPWPTQGFLCRRAGYCARRGKCAKPSRYIAPYAN